MSFIRAMRLLIACLVLPLKTIAQWTSQDIGSAYEGRHNGVTAIDLNQDGASDLIFAAGNSLNRKGQSFALINIGKANDQDTFEFSEAIPIGSRGAYHNVDAVALPSGRVLILLSGGSCGPEGLYCTNAPAELIEVEISDCGFWPYDNQCSTQAETIWTDPNTGGSRIAILSSDLGSEDYPAIVTAGQSGISVFEPQIGVYSTIATWAQSGGSGVFESITSLSTAQVGTTSGFVAGVSLPSSGLLLAFYKTASGQYEYFEISSRDDLKPNGAVVADVDGNGIADVVVASQGKEQNYFQLSSSFGAMGGSTEQNIFNASVGVEAIMLGQIYNTSELPDVVFAKNDGELVLFDNQGVGATPQFLENEKLAIPAGCQIEDMTIAELWPCTLSIICALKCETLRSSGNYIFTTESCDILEWLDSLSSPAASPAFSPTSPSSYSTNTPTATPTGGLLPAPTMSSESTPAPAPVSQFPFSTEGSPAAAPSINTVPSSPSSNIDSNPIGQPGSAQPSESSAESPSSSFNIFPMPSHHPTASPSESFQTGPQTRSPSGSRPPSESPVESPSSNPTLIPTPQPTRMPSHHPTASPSEHPSLLPSLYPSANPTTSAPSSLPSSFPTSFPSLRPSKKPSVQPSETPSTSSPTAQPTSEPSSKPTILKESTLKKDSVDDKSNDGSSIRGYHLLIALGIGLVLFAVGVRVCVLYKRSRSKQNSAKAQIQRDLLSNETVDEQSQYSARSESFNDEEDGGNKGVVWDEWSYNRFGKADQSVAAASTDTKSLYIEDELKSMMKGRRKKPKKTLADPNTVDTVEQDQSVI